MENGKRKFVLLCILLAGCVLTSIVSEYLLTPEPLPLTQSAGQEQAKKQLITVYVSGAVAQPGLYELPEGIRAQEAVAAAGGFTANANLEKVNLAKKLKDGSQVNVPALKSGKKASDAERKEEAAAQAATIIQGQQTVNINTAGVEELDSLPGIGEVTAQRIIAYRSAHPFERIEDIMQVKGIGEAKFNRLKSRITVR